MIGSSSWNDKEMNESSRLNYFISSFCCIVCSWKDIKEKKMAETKSTSRAGSKLNLNESTMPLLDEEAHEKAETPEKDAIEMKEKASTTSEGEKDDSNPEKTVRRAPTSLSFLSLSLSLQSKIYLFLVYCRFVSISIDVGEWNCQLFLFLSGMGRLRNCEWGFFFWLNQEAIECRLSIENVEERFDKETNYECSLFSFESYWSV